MQHYDPDGLTFHATHFYRMLHLQQAGCHFPSTTGLSTNCVARTHNQGSSFWSLNYKFNELFSFTVLFRKDVKPAANYGNIPTFERKKLDGK
jgi:hypothetical protein